MMQTFTGKEYLAIDAANHFGLDKEDWDVRLKWFNDNKPNLEKLIVRAEEPALYFAAVKAYCKAEKGQIVTYPISLDATSSGIQILAALTGDRKAATICNVVDAGNRRDAYTGLYQAMCDKIGDGTKIGRKETKQAIMTAFYSSTAIPKQVFGEGVMLDIFFETMKEYAPGAWELNETMLHIWDPTKYSNDWVLPDNFHVHVKVMSTISENVHFLNAPYEVQYSVNKPMEGGRSLGANMTHSIDGMIVREMARRCMYDTIQVEKLKSLLAQGWVVKSQGPNPEKDAMVKKFHDHYVESGFYSARIIDYLDEHNIDLTNYNALTALLNSLPRKPFEVISVHDCFRCLPNYGNDLRKQYNIILSNIAKSNLLSYILTQLLDRRIIVQKLDPKLWVDILESNYALS